MGIYSIRRPAGLPVALFACVAAASCATMTESQCLEADWYVVGVRDGTLGRPADYVEQHREACKATGIVPDVNEYRTGRRSGLERYCTTRSGFAMGLFCQGPCAR